jgi:hypothetical protein
VAVPSTAMVTTNLRAVRVMTPSLHAYCGSA